MSIAPPTSSSSISYEHLSQTVIAIHNLLSTSPHSLEYRFLGGFQIISLGIVGRTTKDVDVVIKKPLFHGFEKVYRTFKDSKEFKVFEPKVGEEDGLRVIHFGKGGVGVGVDVLMGGAHEKSTKSSLLLSINNVQIPFLTIENLILSKLRACSRRQKRRDVEDIEALWSSYHSKLSCSKIGKHVSDELLERIQLFYPLSEESMGLYDVIQQIRSRA